MVFFTIALGTMGLVATLLLWPIITEQLHLARNIHPNLAKNSSTAKIGLLGGRAFLSFNSVLFKLVSLMLADTGSEDYCD